MALTFIETPHFTRQIAEWVGDGEYRAFQPQLLEDPERGDLLVGRRGLRKVRMALGGRGKSGGARVIYLYLPEDHVLYLFLLFKKSDHANLNKSQRVSGGLSLNFESVKVSLGHQSSWMNIKFSFRTSAAPSEFLLLFYNAR